LDRRLYRPVQAVQKTPVRVSAHSLVPALEVRLPSLHRSKSAGWDLLACQAAELGQNGQAGICVVRVRHEIGPLSPNQDAVQLKGSLLGINSYANLGTPSCRLSELDIAMSRTVNCAGYAYRLEKEEM